MESKNITYSVKLDAGKQIYYFVERECKIKFGGAGVYASHFEEWKAEKEKYGYTFNVIK